MSCLEDSAPGPKGYSEMLRPFTDFQDWRSLEQVQNYRHLVRRSLPSDDARIIFDARVPETSMAELFERLRGRFRPIVSAIVLDEPFALRAAVNFIRKDNPHFHNAICGLFSLSPNESVLVSSWEMAVVPSLIHVFHDKVLSDTALVPSNTVRCDNGLLDSKARIVGLDPCFLRTDYRSMSLNEFLEAHVENGSRTRKDGKKVPAFYHPAEMLSGPDIVFVLHLNNRGFCPVFIQLKLRASMDQLDATDQPDTMSAFTTRAYFQSTEATSENSQC
ncbi:hypothetical protein BGZ81_009701 [Podila clonocystis]|nr:hypothetical protein BGZ81_009701 [Podila clonocystis]